MRENLIALGNDAEIEDERGNVVYRVDGKVFSSRGRTEIKDANGRVVAKIHRKLLALRPTYEIEIEGRETVEVRRTFVAFRDKLTIDLPGDHDRALRGRLLDHDYRISSGDQTIAAIRKRWLSLRDTFGVYVVEGQDDLLAFLTVALLESIQSAERDAAVGATVGGVFASSRDD